MTDLITAALALPAEERGSLARLLMQSLREDKTQDTPDRSEIIISIVCKHCNVSKIDVIRKCREAEVSDARHIVIYMLRKHTRMSLKAIGKTIGGRDHTTAINSVNVASSLIYTDPSFRRMIVEIESSIKQALS